MARYLQTQVECYWRAAHALSQPHIQREVRDSAEKLLKQTAVMGATVKVRMAAIRALHRNHIPAPTVFGGSGPEAA